MTFRAHTASGRTIDFTYGYDATDLVQAEAERQVGDGETVTSVYRVLTDEEQQFRAANGGKRRR